MRILQATVLVAALVAMLAIPVNAQITGQIAGRVVDTSAASVAGAVVTLTSDETGEARTQKSDAEGRFGFQQLRIGPYTIAVTAQGFTRSVAQAPARSGETTLATVRLEIGAVTEKILVEEAVSPLDAASAQIQVSVESRQISELPVTRTPALLALIAPGVTPVSPNNPYLSAGSYNSHGARGRANNITIDNITSTDIATTGVGGGQFGPLNFEQIQEVKLITQNFSAEFGRNGGSQLQVITRSGSNNFHGRLFEFFENDKLNARDFFDRTGAPAVIRNNDYGFAAGGPIRRNRTHFFTSFEQNNVRGMGTARIAQVPTPAMMALVTDATSKRVLETYAVPVAASGQTQQSGTDAQDTRQFSVRIDHQLSERDTLTGRFAYYRQEGTAASLSFIGSNLAGYGASFVNGPRNANLSHTHLFSPSIVNEARFGFGRVSPYFTPQSSWVGPRVQILNLAVDAFGQSEIYPQGRTENTYQFSDTITWMRGAHSLKAGVDVYRYQLNSMSDSTNRGIYRFNTWEDFATGRPSAWQQRFGTTVRGHRAANEFFFVQDDWRVRPNLTLNLGVRAEVAGGVSEVNGLTSNLDPSCRSAMGAAGAGPLGCFVTGKPSNDVNVNWGPRVGVAWTPGRDGKTVLRGGYGIAYDFLFLNPIVNQRALPPFIYTGSLSGVAAFNGANSWSNLIAGTAQAQIDGRASSGTLNPTARNFGTVSPAIDPNLRNPQTQQWSLGVQRMLPAAVVLKAAYVGTKTNYLQRTRAANLIVDSRLAPATSLADEQAKLPAYSAAITASAGTAATPSNRYDPRFNDVNVLDSSANSNYHAFELSAQRAFTAGLSLQVSFTHSRSIDDVSDALGGTLINDSSGQQNPRNNRDNRAVSQFDIPNRLVVAHVWELPFGKRAANRWVKRMAAGWSFSGISSFRSGFPVTFDAGSRRGASPLTLTGMTGGPVRPNAAGPFDFRPVASGSAEAVSTLNTDPVQRISTYAASLGLSQPLLGGFGSLGRNAARLNSAPSFDWSFAKTTPLCEHVRLQLRGEIYNVFNQAVFQDLGRSITSATFGQYTTTAYSSRYVLLGARLIF